METVADLSTDLTRIIPVGSAKCIRVIQKVSSIADILRCEGDGEAFADGFGKREGKFGVVGQMLRSLFIEKAGTVRKICSS